jgi:MFS family permease
MVRLFDEFWSYLPAGTIDDQVTDLGLSYTQAGWLLALLTLGGLLLGPVAGVADRGYRKTLAVTGAASIAAGLAAFAVGAPFVVLAIAAGLMGGASDMVIRPLESTLAEVGGEHLDRLLATQHVVTWLGDAVGPALLALGAATVIGWQGVFAIGAVMFVAFAAVLTTVRFPQPVEAEPEAAEAHTTWRMLLRHREVIALSGAEFVMLPLDEAFLGFAVARTAASGSPAVAQLLAGGVVVGGVLGSLRVARVGLCRARVRWGSALMALGAFVSALPLHLAVNTVGMTALGWGTAVLWAKVHHRSLTVLPGRSASVPTIVSIVSTPSLVLPAAMGWLADRGSITVVLFAAACLTVPLAGFVLALGGDLVRSDELASLDG